MNCNQLYTLLTTMSFEQLLEVARRYGFPNKYIQRNPTKVVLARDLIQYAELDLEKLAAVVQQTPVPESLFPAPRSLPPIPSLSADETSLATLQTWVRQHYQSKIFDRNRVERFIGFYRDTAQERVAFVGRETALQALDDWWRQSVQRFLLLTGAAGRGKSALLLHWLDALLAGAEPPVLFFLPISIRANSSDEVSGLRLLHSVLCDEFAELKFAHEAKPVAEDYRDRLAEGWEWVRDRAEQRFLLVVDGADEATNHWFLHEVLPVDIPPNLHVLVSARFKAGHADGQAWLADFAAGLSDRAVLATLLTLDTLAQAAMADAVIQLGHPLDQLAERESFTQALYRLTDQGDPLLLRLWLGLIWQNRTAVPDWSVEELKQQAPSFSGFYTLWLDEQQKVWQAQGLAVHRADFTWLMQLLATAYAPLRLEDVQALLSLLDLPVVWSYETLRAVLESAQRLVVGDAEQGFALLHPRLADYFQQQLMADKPRQRKLERVFLTWGQGVVADLNRGALLADECPVYLLRHYVAHVQESRLSLKEKVDSYFLALLERGWVFAWDYYEGLMGYLDDLVVVEQVVREYNQSCAKAEKMLYVEVRIALISTSIFTLTQSWPVELVVMLVETKEWSLTRGVKIAEQYENVEKKAECLVLLAKTATKIEAENLLNKAFQMIKISKNKFFKAKILSLMALQFPIKEKIMILKTSIEISTKIKCKKKKIEIMNILIPQLKGKKSLLEQALMLINKSIDILKLLVPQFEGNVYLLKKTFEVVLLFSDEELRIKALSILVTYSNGDCDLLKEVFKESAKIKDEQLLVKILGQITAQSKQNAKLLQHIIKVAETIKSERFRAEILSILSGQLIGNERQSILTLAFQTAIQIGHERLRSEALSLVAVQSKKEDYLLQIVKQTETMKFKLGCVRILSAAASQLPKEERYTLLQKAFRLAKEITVERAFTEALEILILQFKSDIILLQQALKEIQVIKIEGHRVSALGVIAPQLYGNSPLLKESLEIATSIEDEKYRNHALNIVITQLKGENILLRQALQSVMEIIDKDQRISILYRLALQSTNDSYILQKIIQASIIIGDEQPYIEVLCELVIRLPNDENKILLQKILQTTKKIKNQKNKLGCVITLSFTAIHLEEEKMNSLLQQSLQIIRTIEDRFYQAHALEMLANTYLPNDDNLLKEALHIAKGTRDYKIIKNIENRLKKKESDILKIKQKSIQEKKAEKTAKKDSYKLWQKLLKKSPSQKRENILVIIRELTTIITNPNEAKEIARAVMDVGEWWP